MTPEARDRLVAFLLQRCYLVVIAVANVDMAHRVFTVLNARGLDLTPADILKADLLDRVAAADEKDYSQFLGGDRGAAWTREVWNFSSTSA